MSVPCHLEKPLLITTGEPAGIGMDIVIDVLCYQADDLPKPIFITADVCAWRERISMLQQLGKITDAPNFEVIESAVVIQDADYLMTSLVTSPKQKVFIINTPCKYKVIAGQLCADNAPMVEMQLNLAHHLAVKGIIAGIITAPIQKSILMDADVRLDNGEVFSGHTEYFMHKSGCDKVVMMLANAKMRVALVTTHIPLKEVAKAITGDEIYQTVAITHRAMREQFGIIEPKILVCGLNPHAGESGHLGDEETTVINPVLQKFIDDGMDISLTMPADTLFTKKYLQYADVVIAMYHDQGLAPLKSHGFGDTVNITLGLPYVRTSVDHGTALDLAGTGKASASSLIQAIKVAYQMCGNLP